MAIRSSVEANGNGNGALDDSLLATGVDKRLAHAHKFLRLILKNKGPEILRGAGYTEAEIEYITPVFGNLDTAHQSDNNGQKWVYRSLGDNLGHRRSIEYESPQSRLVRIGINRASDPYLRNNPEAGSLTEVKAMEDGSGERTIGRLLLLAQDLYLNDNQLSLAMAATEFAPSKLVDRLQPFAGLLRAVGLPSPLRMERQESDAGKDILMSVGYPGGSQRWREAVSTPNLVLLSKVRLSAQ